MSRLFLLRQDPFWKWKELLYMVSNRLAFGFIYSVFYCALKQNALLVAIPY